MISSGLVRVEDDGFPVPKLADEAWEVLRGNRAFTRHEDTRIEPEKARAKAPDDGPFHAGLFEHLRVLRKQIADEDQVPPYVVFNDRTLKRVAAHMPTDLETFGALPGVGGHKCATYGERFTAAVAEYMHAHPDVAAERLPLNEPQLAMH